MRGSDAGKNPGTGLSVSPAESEKRSWIQRRSCDHYIKAHGRGGSLVDSQKWSPCYEQALKDWEQMTYLPKEE